MGDDVGWNDLSYHQKSLSHSPNLDALALDGVRLINHHSFKVCGPSRAAFHTGRLPWQMGYYDNSAAAVPWLSVDSNRMGVSLNFSLLPEVLSEHANYTAHAIGKWHLGHVTRDYTPTYRGYSSFLGYYDAMTEDYWAHTHSTGSGAPGGCRGPGLGGLWPALSNNSGQVLGHSADNGTYESVLFGDRAVEIIERHAAEESDRPLFLYVAFHNEHDPHQAPLDSVNDALTAGKVKSDTYKVTVAQIATMDAQIGRIVDAMNRTGMLSNSVISFSSDNGGPLDHANNWPRRGGKHGFYEGGVRTEAFVWGSDNVMAQAVRGTKYRGLMHLADWRATYAMGAAGLSRDQAMSDGGPFDAESVDQWSAIMSTGTTKDEFPRTELLHNIHSPLYYPGNCSIHAWSSRNCPAVITSGDLKLMLGFVGDPRRLELDEAVTSPVPFGQSGGRCGIDDGASNGTRCDAPGKGGKPAPKPGDPGGCLYGCLFNVTGDIGESENLINRSEYAEVVASMRAALDRAGVTAPAWFQAPETSKYSDAELGTALCDAAKRAGSVQPLDF